MKKISIYAGLMALSAMSASAIYAAPDGRADQDGDRVVTKAEAMAAADARFAKMDANGEVNLSLPAVTWANHAAFYSNVQKSNISVGNLSFGNGHDVNGVARPRTDVGAQIVQGMRLDYFEFKSTNLPR